MSVVFKNISSNVWYYHCFECHMSYSEIERTYYIAELTWIKICTMDRFMGLLVTINAKKIILDEE